MRARGRIVFQACNGDVFGRPEAIVVSFLLDRQVEGTAIPLDPVREQILIEVVIGIALLLIGRVLETRLDAAEFGGLELDGVRLALVEPRGAVVADADVRQHVARRGKVSAGSAEHLQGIAVILIDRVHVAELYQAETGSQADERVAVREGATHACVYVHRLLDLPEGPQDGAAEVSLAT